MFARYSVSTGLHEAIDKRLKKNHLFSLDIRVHSEYRRYVNINLAFDKKLVNLVAILFSKCETIATTADKTNQDLILIDHKLRKLSEPCGVKLSVYIAT